MRGAPIPGPHGSLTTRRVQAVTSEADYVAVAPVVRELAQERFMALLLEARIRLLSVVTPVEIGTSTCTDDPQVLFAAIVVGGGQAIIVAGEEVASLLRAWPRLFQVADRAK